jgi:hypothetical protein
VSQFKRDIEKKMLNPEYAYEFGRAERELEIIELLEEQAEITGYVEIKLSRLIALIKGENK